MTNEQKRVKDFMQFFGQETPEKPTQIDFETCKLRANLMLEELFELITKGLGLKIKITNKNKDNQYIEIDESNLMKLEFNYDKIKEVDLVQVADGVGDGIVVGLGTSVACGIDQEPINLEIFDSNDSKAWTKDDLEKAKKLYPTAKVEKYSENLYRLIREDGKVIKSPSYQPARIKELIEQQIK